MKKKILFLTGTRADFGKLKPLMQQVEESEEFECQIFATGMHTLTRYGNTYKEIQKSGFKNTFLYINQMANNNSAMDIVLSNTIQGLGHYIREFETDLIIVHGDRVETLAGATVGALNNILVAHIEGGEISGTVDELLRHSVSKLAHLHFVANEDAQRRLIQMGEYQESIFVIGSPDVDIMLSDTLPPLSEVKKRYDIPYDKYSIFMFHPVTTELQQLRGNIRQTLAALQESEQNFVVIYPNNDAGSETILEEMQPLHHNPRFRFFPSLRFEYFLSLLRHADSIVGNSSAGVREAPVYGLPSINIGSRQMNRFHHPSIINVNENKSAILQALKLTPKGVPPSLHFGQGKSAELFMQCLRRPELWIISRQKQFRDL